MMLKVTDLDMGYGESQVLFGVSMEVKKGEIVSLVGANAAGKTSLINGISGICKPWKGKIEYCGEDITNSSPEKRIELGLIQCPEGRRLFPQMTVEENLQMGAYSKRARGDYQKNREKVYEMFPKLKSREHQIAGSMSGGEQQMCAIGRAIMANPGLLMLDEPSLGLAPIIVQQMFQIIKQINDQQMTILLVEQNVQKALSMAENAYVIEGGSIVLKGKTEELMGNDDLRKAYLGI